MDDQSQATSTDSLIVVGVGASAGGLEAFSEVLKHLPPTTGMAFVFIQHLDRHHYSALPELLSGKTRMPVIQVHHGVPLEPDRVYVIPPDSVMTVRNRSLHLQARPERPERFRPIDSFLQSLAEAFGANSIGVVLSGTATDGTSGLKAIKAEGGITFAQNESAQFDGMPRSAIAAGVVDFVLSPRRIAEELAAIAQRPVELDKPESELAADDNGSFRGVLVLLRKHSAVDFTEYKQPTILRRLHRRMAVRRAETLAEYYQILKKDDEEVSALFDDLLIHVTDFFRDPKMFEAAKQSAFPHVLKERKRPGVIRVWIPGCSSGEEVYSLAIALMEFLESEKSEWSMQMFGTDISDAAIAKARAGHYDEGSVLNVSPDRLRRFFLRTETGYQINRSIRELCVFSKHNVAKDPPLSRMDLISCRNLLIYFSPALQQRVTATFAYALQPSGCLVLGPSETLGALSDYFQPLDETHKIYCRKPDAMFGTVPPTGRWGDGVTDLTVQAGRGATAEPADWGRRVRQRVDRLVLSKYSPAAVVVDEFLRIIEYRGDLSNYLKARGAVGENLLRAVREELGTPLDSAMEDARRSNAAVVAERIPLIADGGAPALATITVVPIGDGGTTQHFLVLFAHSSLDPGPETLEDPQPAPADKRQLEAELRSVREYLQSVIEELRSSNEEVQSANEELQSTNEELQTSKEELQSSNEELHTINTEMQSRNVELGRLNDDLLNLLASMNMPVIMTGCDLRIRRFTPMAERVLRLIPTDIGRPISDLKPRINVPKLEEILQKVLDTLEPFEQETQDAEGRVYLLRVRPYRTADNRIDGTVVQLLDVSELKRSLEESKHARDYAEAIVNTIREPLLILDQTFTIQHANRAVYENLHLTQEETLGRGIFEVGRGQFDVPPVRRLLQQVDGEPARANDVEIEWRAERNDVRILSANIRRLQGLDNKQLILMALADITGRKNAAEARYRRLFESARDGIVSVDAESGDIIDMNPYLERLLGYSRTELVGRKLWDTGLIGDLPMVRPTLRQIRDQGVMRFDELSMRTKDGSAIQTEVIANLYTEGERRAIQFNIRDVSERKKFERELQETQKLESLGLLAGGIAHDFNNLLTGILGNASFAYTELPPDEPARMRLREIVQASERAAFLTRQMLAYAGRGPFVKEVFDLGGLVREISVLIRASIAKTVELVLNLAPNLPSIEADPAQIQQVVMNLVINAAEAIGENTVGRVEVRTSLREYDEGELFRPEQLAPGPYVQLEVVDTGSGIDEATQARIFDPFFTTKFTGRGLGLAAVQGIVKRHGGAIRVYSTPGHGTTFLVVLPAGSALPKSTRVEETKTASIPADSVALVIDDVEAVRTLADRVLARAGMKVWLANDGESGVELFRKLHSTLSVVILDLQMLVMSGEEALAQLKEIDASVPVILSSGFSESEARQRLSGLQPDGFLQKPYTSDRLVRAVASVLKGK